MFVYYTQANNMLFTQASQPYGRRIAQGWLVGKQLCWWVGTTMMMMTSYPAGWEGVGSLRRAALDNSTWCANRNGFSSFRSFGLSGCVVAASAWFGTRTRKEVSTRRAGQSGSITQLHATRRPLSFAWCWHFVCSAFVQIICGFLCELQYKKNSAYEEWRETNMISVVLPLIGFLSSLSSTSVLTSDQSG